MKTVWVTGASSGIGLALVRLLVRLDYKVIATARNLQTLAELASQYPHLQLLQADLTSDTDLARIPAFFIDRDLRLDCIVVNAGTCEYMEEARLDADTLRRVYDINFFAAVKTIDIALPLLKRSADGGHIIGISSMSILLPFSRAEYYGSSKAAFSYYLQSLRVDVRGSGITVSEVLPGFVETPLTQRNTFPMPFIIDSDEAAREILHVMRKRMNFYSFPKPLYYCLRIIAMIPWLWPALHKNIHHGNITAKET